jgi:hypothetical protein
MLGIAPLDDHHARLVRHLRCHSWRRRLSARETTARAGWYVTFFHFDVLSYKDRADPLTER